MKLRGFLVVAVLSVLISSCFSRWIMTDKEINEHYANRKSKPIYHTIQTDSAKIHFVSFGDETKQPILFIHGAPGSWDGYLNFLDDTTLQKNFHLISVDRPGYGKSQTKPKKKVYTLEEQARAIELSLKSNYSGKKAIIIGRSYGVPVAVKLAALYPQSVQKIVLLSPAIDPEKEKFWWFSGFGKIFLIRWFLPERMNTATDEKFAHIAELRKLEADYAKIQAEITVMQGGQDNIIDQSNFDYAKKMLAGKNAHFIYIPESGHLISRSRPDLVMKEIYDSENITDGNPQSIGSKQ
ncbi:MAG: alpha/beta hydrolase [Spirosomaceae bacterium]|jgi:pimeloyl-ACP methyl ester carboxylesterase|nr:alpha/beta hydrolase [Spirosomataceae bacterium]